MSKNNNEEFVYYLHGTTVNNQDIIDDIFNNGLINYRGNDMLSTMWPVKVNEGELTQRMKEYVGTKGNAVFVIKIPKYYLTPRVKDGQLVQIPLPIWKHISNSGDHGKISRLTPELVYGVYLSDTDSFVFNHNYSPVHNPNGLQFDNSQIEYLTNYVDGNWLDFINKRNNYIYDELAVSDQEQKNWDDAVLQYKQHFGIETNHVHR